MNGLNDNVHQVYITGHLVQYFFTFRNNVFLVADISYCFFIVNRANVFVICVVFVHICTFYEMAYFSML